MNPEQVTTLLIEINKNVGVLLSRDVAQEKTCDARLLLIGDMEDRLKVVENFVREEKAYRRVVLLMLTGLSILVTWGMDLAPKLVALISSPGVGR